VPSALRIGIHVNSTTYDGPARYVQALLKALEGSEFEPVLFGRAAGPFARWPGLRAIDADPATREGSGDALSPPTSKRVMRAAWRRMPAPARRAAGLWRDIQRLEAVLGGERLAMLHTNCMGFDQGPVAGRRARAPLILGTLHVDPPAPDSVGDSDWLSRRLAGHNMRALDASIAVSAHTGAAWQRLYRETPEPVMIHNGVDVDAFQPVARDPNLCVVVMVARMTRAKGGLDLLKAAEKLATEVRHLHLVFAGTGDLLDELKTRVAAGPLAGRVRFLGHVEDVASVYGAASIAVLPSHAETFGYSVLEAMACGLPVLATRVGGIPELVKDGETGFLVGAHNVDELAARLRHLALDPDLRATFGVAARQRAEARFSVSRMTDATLAVYSQLLNGE
jgi:glycosyltransferase involved in cell wall biosynthesis